MLLGAFVSVVGGLAVSFTSSWKATLVILAFMPLLFLGALFTNRLIITQGKSTEGVASAGQVSFYETPNDILTQ